MIALIGLIVCGVGLALWIGWLIIEMVFEYSLFAGLIMLLTIGGAVTALIGHYVFGQL